MISIGKYMSFAALLRARENGTKSYNHYLERISAYHENIALHT